MKSILKSALFLVLLCSCKEESVYLAYAFFNNTPDKLNIVYFKNSSERTEPVGPNYRASILEDRKNQDVLEGINYHYDSISVYDDDSHLLCKFSKTSTYNYRGNPFIDRDKWLYQGINKVQIQTQTTTYLNVHEYWFKIEYDSIIVHR